MTEGLTNFSVELTKGAMSDLSDIKRYIEDELAQPNSARSAILATLMSVL